MKVAFILPSLLNRGPIIFTKYLSNALIDLGVEVSVFYFRAVDVDDRASFNCETQKIGFFESDCFTGFDIIHTTMLKPDLYGALHTKKFKGKVVSSLHNELVEDLRYNYNPIMALLLSKLWRFALSRLNNKIFSSYAQRNYYKDIIKVDSERSSIIPYGIRITHSKIEKENYRFDQLEILKSKYTVLGSCGMLIKRKGFEQIIEFLKTNQDMCFFLIGNGPELESLQTLASDLEVSDRIVFLGFQDDHLKYYRFFDIYVHASYSEGFGLAMLEALALGLPLVCSDLPIYKDHFDSHNVSLFIAGDQEDLAIAVRRSAGDLLNFSEKSLALFSQYFSADAMAERHIECYKRMLNTAEGVAVR